MQEQEFQRMLEGGERKNIDFKGPFNWETSTKKERLGIVKDLLSMANTSDGGQIVIGVKDEDNQLVGLTNEEMESFDTTKLNDFLHKYTDPKTSCIVKKLEISQKKVVIIEVPEFVEDVIICKTNGHDEKNNMIVSAGKIYVRTAKGTSEAVSDAQEMRELLGRAISKKGDQLLEHMQRIVSGKRPVDKSEEALAKYKQEMDGADEYFKEKIDTEIGVHGYWKVTMYPLEYNPNRLENNKQIKEALESCQVTLRGWYFPHMHKDSSNFASGWQGFTIWEGIIEALRAFQSGLFIWKGVVREDTAETRNENGKRIIYYVSTIYLVTEIFLFAKRYFEKISPDQDVYIKLELVNIQDRALSASGMVMLHNHYVSQEKGIVIEGNYPLAELISNNLTISRKVVQKILSIFNCDNISDEIIESWQQKLISRNP